MRELNIFLEGFITGIGMSMMLGTVFFSILQQSVNRGVRYGIFIAGGVVLSDVMFISLTFFGVGFVVMMEQHGVLIGRVGSILLFLFGVYQFQKKTLMADGVLIQPEGKNFWRGLYYVGNGFFLNSINPVNFFLWLSISGFLTFTSGYSVGERVLFFTASVISIFVVESMFAFYAFKIRRWLNSQRLTFMNRVIGVIFMLIAMYLFFTINARLSALNGHI
jgi:L-lysine exporter family protein LysE/ArgO